MNRKIFKSLQYYAVLTTLITLLFAILRDKYILGCEIHYFGITSFSLLAFVIATKDIVGEK